MEPRPTAADFERASDPWVDVSPNGAAYQIAIAFNGLDLTNAVTVSKSTDGGATWSALKTLIRDSGQRDSSWAFNDKESITADPFDSNYVYAVRDRLVSPNNKSKASLQGLLNSKTFRGPVWFSRTTNGGASWETARMIADPGSHNQTIGNQIDVLPNGALLDLFTEFVAVKNKGGNRGSHFAVIRSSDRGSSWGDAVGGRGGHLARRQRSRDRVSRSASATAFRTSRSTGVPALPVTGTPTSCGRGRAPRPPRRTTRSTSHVRPTVARPGRRRSGSTRPPPASQRSCHRFTSQATGRSE